MILVKTLPLLLIVYILGAIVWPFLKPLLKAWRSKSRLKKPSRLRLMTKPENMDRELDDLIKRGR